MVIDEQVLQPLVTATKRAHTRLAIMPATQKTAQLGDATDEFAYAQTLTRPLLVHAQYFDLGGNVAAKSRRPTS